MKTLIKHLISLACLLAVAYYGQAQVSDGSLRQPPELLSPYHKETVKVSRPLLTWKAPLPLLGNQVRYSLKLVEVRKGQSLVQAIGNNVPIIQNRSVDRTFLPYPVGIQGLEVGKTYAWQVLAYAGGRYLGQTDIWQFVYSIEKSVVMPPVVSYPFVKQKIEDTEYIVNDTISFAYDNRFNEQNLNYEIFENNQKINAIPAVPLSLGINKVKLVVANLQDGRHYTLIIRDRANERYYLPFIYQETQTQ